tara:strand:+ start:612 stop:845 length:234 start_codon:yes stop_codon:yes gene_type:complete
MLFTLPTDLKSLPIPIQKKAFWNGQFAWLTEDSFIVFLILIVSAVKLFFIVKIQKNFSSDNQAYMDLIRYVSIFKYF